MRDGRGSRLLGKDVEDDAGWQSGALLVPEEGVRMVVRRGWPLAKAADDYGVTE